MNRVELWSCGGGRQSVLILGLIKRGELPRPEHAAMVDTNRERASTWEYLNKVIRPELEGMRIPFTIIDRSKYATVDLWGGVDGDTVLIPAFTDKNGGDGGKFSEYCSGEWKREVIKRWATEQLGWKSRGVNTWIGITQEEKHRRRSARTLWIQPTYPLLDAAPSHVSRVFDVCKEFGWPDPVRSCCWMCPNMHNREWLDMRENYPNDFEKACELDDGIRQTDPNVFVHKDRVPLRMADLGKPEAAGLFGGGCSSGMCY